MKIAVFLLALLLPLQLSAGPLITQDDPVIGQINKKDVRLSEIEDKEINDLRIKLFEAVSGKLRSKALQSLAKTEPDFQKRPNLQVSDKDAQAFYVKNKLSERGPYKDLKPQIVQFLKAQQLQAKIDALYNRALKQGKISLALKKPEVLLAEIPVETAFLWNRPNAKVMVLEFSDYQCPFCGRVQETLTEIRKEYKTRAWFGYRHFPLQFHDRADDAAVAVECAREQGKFDPYHKLLFEHQQALSDGDLKSYAKQVGVKNLGKFNKCLDTQKYMGQVHHDINQAASIGVRGTPSFLIGFYDKKTKRIKGELVSGALPKSELTRLLDKYLAL